MSNIFVQKRLTDILFNHWNNARGERLFPSRDNIDEFILQKDGVWDDIFIVDIFPLVQSNGYRFSYTGKNLSKESSKDGNGKIVQNIITSLLQNADEKYNIVSEQKRPLQDEKIYTLPESNITVKYRQILLPLGPGDDDAVDAIIGGMRFVYE